MSLQIPNAPRFRQGYITAFALAGAIALLGFGDRALAQEAAPDIEMGEPAEGASELGNWIKICADEEVTEGRETCLVTQEVRTEQGEFLASVSVRTVEGEEGKALMVAVPPGTLLQPGMRVQVDEGEQRPGQYVICLPNACYSELEIDEAFVNEMKRGQNLIISVINNQGEPVGVGLTLIGFTAGYDGPPVDTELLARERQRLQEQLQRRAADARERLLQQQQQQQQEGAPAEGQ